MQLVPRGNDTRDQQRPHQCFRGTAAYRETSLIVRTERTLDMMLRAVGSFASRSSAQRKFHLSSIPRYWRGGI